MTLISDGLVWHSRGDDGRGELRPERLAAGCVEPGGRGLLYPNDSKLVEELVHPLQLLPPQSRSTSLFP